MKPSPEPLRQTFTGLWREGSFPCTLRLDGTEGEPNRHCRDRILALALTGCFEESNISPQRGDTVKVTVEIVQEGGHLKERAL